MAATAGRLFRAKPNQVRENDIKMKLELKREPGIDEFGRDYHGVEEQDGGAEYSAKRDLGRCRRTCHTCRAGEPRAYNEEESCVCGKGYSEGCVREGFGRGSIDAYSRPH